MIIDFHTHIFPDELAPRALQKLTECLTVELVPVTNATKSGLLRYMDECGVDASVVLPVLTKQSQTVGTNEWAASIQSDRILSFGGIYPHTDDYKRDIDFVVSLGLRGLKFHAEYQDFVVDDPKMLKIYDYALSRGLPIIHHAGMDYGFPPPYRSRPEQFRNIVRAMRGGVVIAAHFGGHGQWDDVERYLVGENIYLDTSMGFEYFSQDVFMRITREHGADKILFGTDSPWSAAKTEIEHLKATPLTDSEKEMIFSGNAKRILRLR